MKRKVQKPIAEWSMNDVEHRLYESNFWGRVVHGAQLLLAKALLATLIERQKKRTR